MAPSAGRPPQSTHHGGWKMFCMREADFELRDLQKTKFITLKKVFELSAYNFEANKMMSTHHNVIVINLLNVRNNLMKSSERKWNSANCHQTRLDDLHLPLQKEHRYALDVNVTK